MFSNNPCTLPDLKFANNPPRLLSRPPANPPNNPPAAPPMPPSDPPNAPATAPAALF